MTEEREIKLNEFIVTPNPDCKDCYGRGKIKYNGVMSDCMCIVKKMNKEFDKMNIMYDDIDSMHLTVMVRERNTKDIPI